MTEGTVGPAVEQLLACQKDNVFGHKKASDYGSDLTTLSITTEFTDGQLAVEKELFMY